MQRFRFRLERAYQWQQKVCQLKEEDVRLSLAAISETDERIAQLTAVRISAEHELLSRTAYTATDLTALAEFRRKGALEHQALERQKAAQMGDLEQKRGVLNRERRRLRLFEKLRARALHEHQAATDREFEAIGMESHMSRRVSEAAVTRS